MQLAPNSQPVNISSPNMINFSFNIIFKTDKSKRGKYRHNHLASGSQCMVTDGYQMILCGSVKWQVLPNEGETNE